MNRRSFLLMLVMLAAWPVTGAKAQFLSPLSDGQTAYYINYYPDPVLAYSVGFATGDGDVMHVTDLRVPVHPEEQDWQLKLGGQSNGSPGWDISPAVSIFFRYREREKFSFDDTGMEFTWLFGYYWTHGFAVAEYGYSRFTNYFSGMRLGASVWGLEINLRYGNHHRTSRNDGSEPSYLTGGLNFRF